MKSLRKVSRLRNSEYMGVNLHMSILRLSWNNRLLKKSETIASMAKPGFKKHS